MNSIATTTDYLERGGKSLNFLAFLCWKLVVGIIFNGTICGGLGQDFHVKGEVEYKYYSTVYTREFEFSVKGTVWQGVIERKLPDSVASGPVTLPNGKVMPGPPLNGRVPGEKIFENGSELTIMGAKWQDAIFLKALYVRYFSGVYLINQPEWRQGSGAAATVVSP